MEEKLQRAKEAQERREREKEAKTERKPALVDWSRTGKVSLTGDANWLT